MTQANQFLIIFFTLLYSCTPTKLSTIEFRDKPEEMADYEIKYESGNWEHPNYRQAFESLGNQRVFVEIEDSESDNVYVQIPWRRSDANPSEKDIIIVDASTNQSIKNKYIIEITSENGELIFQSIEGSKRYYIYFLPHHSSGSYYPKLAYNKTTKSKENSWVTSVENNITDLDNFTKAHVVSIQSIDDFHSCFPMEVIATEKEVTGYIENNPQDFYLFPEYRDHPIRMTDHLPYRWVKNIKLLDGLIDTISKGEYYSFQIGLYSPIRKLEDVRIEFSDFKSPNGNSISHKLITCFNAGGVDLEGEPFNKNIEVEAGKVQALWFGLEVPRETKAGTYMGKIIIRPDSLSPDTVYIKLQVTSEILENYGDDTPEKLTRLRWLNSTVGTEKDAIISPFLPVLVSAKKITILGREIELNEFGFPQNISSYFSQEMTKFNVEKEAILKEAIQFEIINKIGPPVQWDPSAFKVTQDFKSSASWKTSNNSDEFTMNVSGLLEYDGMLDLHINIIAKKDLTVEDMKLQIPMQKDASSYILGLGNKGGTLKDNIHWKWDITKHQEGAWLGNINKGLQYVLRDNNYERPLNTNFYQNKPLNLPPSWYNDGKGGINITRDEEKVNIENYSGARAILKGDTLNFNIRFLITPFKLIDTKAHFETRFVHKYIPVDSVIAYNGTVVNVHHANEINPYINYPFYNLEKQKKYIDEAHEKGVKVKLYNTIRELTYKSYELFALKSLGDEIFNDGEGGGHSWLQEHLKSNYHSAWHATEVNDAAILNKGTSRWTNYYIEGINWLAKNQKIDGLYLDDIAFSRSTVKRIASVFNKHRDSFIIDLHSANQFNPRDGFTNSAFLYMEHFPYISRLWFGEYFDYNMPPDFWLTEVSGIPFGLTGEMLEKGGHPYRGLVYGMTTRVYGAYNPGAIWKLFKDFDIANSEMLGYWVDRSPIKTNHKNIKSTIYIHTDKVLIAMGSWSDQDETIKLEIDWDSLGMDKSNVQLFSPEIQRLQQHKVYDINKPILVEKGKGLLLILSKK